jgi:4a-hydroxytetrahydrobiopterin dehydratase
MVDLKSQECVPCRGDEPPVTTAEMKEYLPQIAEWKVVEIDGIPRLERQYKFKNFRKALDFTNKVGEIAEEQDHHPILITEWGKVKVTWWTHAIKGLHRNDFIMAAKTDEIYSELSQAQESAK